MKITLDCGHTYEPRDSRPGDPYPRSLPPEVGMKSYCPACQDYDRTIVKIVNKERKGDKEMNLRNKITWQYTAIWADKKPVLNGTTYRGTPKQAIHDITAFNRDMGTNDTYCIVRFGRSILTEGSCSRVIRAIKDRIWADTGKEI